MCNTLNIKVLELYCNIKKWNIELDTLSIYHHFTPQIKRMRHQSVNQKDFGVQKKTRNR